MRRIGLAAFGVKRRWSLEVPSNDEADVDFRMSLTWSVSQQVLPIEINNEINELPGIPEEKVRAYFFLICSIAFRRLSSKSFSSGSFVELAISTAF